MVKTNVYPVPNPNFPFLGVHITPTVQGETGIPFFRSMFYVLLGAACLRFQRRCIFDCSSSSLCDCMERVDVNGCIVNRHCSGVLYESASSQPFFLWLLPLWSMDTCCLSVIYVSPGRGWTGTSYSSHDSQIPPTPPTPQPPWISVKGHLTCLIPISKSTPLKTYHVSHQRPFPLLQASCSWGRMRRLLSRER